VVVLVGKFTPFSYRPFFYVDKYVDNSVTNCYIYLFGNVIEMALYYYVIKKEIICQNKSIHLT
jgi:hypothetical protein